LVTTYAVTTFTVHRYRYATCRRRYPVPTLYYPVRGRLRVCNLDYCGLPACGSTLPVVSYTACRIGLLPVPLRLIRSHVVARFGYYTHTRCVLPLPALPFTPVQFDVTPAFRSHIAATVCRFTAVRAFAHTGCLQLLGRFTTHRFTPVLDSVALYAYRTCRLPLPTCPVVPTTALCYAVPTPRSRTRFATRLRCLFTVYPSPDFAAHVVGSRLQLPFPFTTARHRFCAVSHRSVYTVTAVTLLVTWFFTLRYRTYRYVRVYYRVWLVAVPLVTFGYGCHARFGLVCGLLHYYPRGCGCACLVAPRLPHAATTRFAVRYPLTPHTTRSAILRLPLLFYVAVCVHLPHHTFTFGLTYRLVRTAFCGYLPTVTPFTVYLYSPHLYASRTIRSVLGSLWFTPAPHYVHNPLPPGLRFWLRFATFAHTHCCFGLRLPPRLLRYYMVLPLVLVGYAVYFCGSHHAVGLVLCHRACGLLLLPLVARAVTDFRVILYSCPCLTDRVCTVCGCTVPAVYLDYARTLLQHVYARLRFAGLQRFGLNAAARSCVWLLPRCLPPRSVYLADFTVVTYHGSYRIAFAVTPRALPVLLYGLPLVGLPRCLVYAPVAAFRLPTGYTPRFTRALCRSRLVRCDVVVVICCCYCYAVGFTPHAPSRWLPHPPRGSHALLRTAPHRTAHTVPHAVTVCRFPSPAFPAVLQFTTFTLQFAAAWCRAVQFPSLRSTCAVNAVWLPFTCRVRSTRCCLWIGSATCVHTFRLLRLLLLRALLRAFAFCRCLTRFARSCALPTHRAFGLGYTHTLRAYRLTFGLPLHAGYAHAVTAPLLGSRVLAHLPCPAAPRGFSSACAVPRGLQFTTYRIGLPYAFLRAAVAPFNTTPRFYGLYAVAGLVWITRYLSRFGLVRCCTLVAGCCVALLRVLHTTHTYAVACGLPGFYALPRAVAGLRCRARPIPVLRLHRVRYAHRVACVYVLPHTRCACAVYYVYGYTLLLRLPAACHRVYGSYRVTRLHAFAPFTRFCPFTPAFGCSRVLPFPLPCVPFVRTVTRLPGCRLRSTF